MITTPKLREFCEDVEAAFRENPGWRPARNKFGTPAGKRLCGASACFHNAVTPRPGEPAMIRRWVREHYEFTQAEYQAFTDGWDDALRHFRTNSERDCYEAGRRLSLKLNASRS